MTAKLRPLGDDDARRADAVASFLGRYEQSPESQRTMESALRSIVGLCPEQCRDLPTFEWHLAADAGLYDEIQQRVTSAVAPATAAKYMAALRGLLRHLGRHQVADMDSVILTIEGAAPVRSTPTKLAEAITTTDLRRMLRACLADPSPTKGVRDAAMLATLAGTGVRRAELTALDRQHVDLDERTASFLKTKGGKDRVIPIHPIVGDYLTTWFELLAVKAGPAFCAVVKDGTATSDKPISGHQLWKIVAQRREQAGIARRVTPHSFRRWFVTSLLEAGVDLLTVTRAVGHTSPSTTQRYDRRDERILRDTVDRLEIPLREDLEDEAEDNQV